MIVDSPEHYEGKAAPSATSSTANQSNKAAGDRPRSYKRAVHKIRGLANSGQGQLRIQLKRPSTLPRHAHRFEKAHVPLVVEHAHVRQP